MREIRTYGATSGDWKRSGEAWIEAPAVPVNCYSPLPLRNRASRRLYKLAEDVHDVWCMATCIKSSLSVTMRNAAETLLDHPQPSSTKRVA
jgi:hypothetical protein